MGIWQSKCNSKCRAHIQSSIDTDVDLFWRPKINKPIAIVIIVIIFSISIINIIIIGNTCRSNNCGRDIFIKNLTSIPIISFDVSILCYGCIYLTFIVIIKGIPLKAYKRRRK